jgi:exonuclease III
MCVINCQSIRNKADVLVDYIKDNNLDMVAMTETWLKSDDNRIIGDLTPSGFKLIHLPRQGRRGGGVGLLYKETISVSDKIDESTPSLEAFSVYVKTETTSFRLIVIYRLIPGGKGPRRADFHVDFADLLDKYVPKPGPLVIVGDFNIHWDNDCPEQRELKDLLESTNLKQWVNETTHEDGHIIDLVITRHDDTIVKGTTVPTFFSDHGAIHIDMNATKPCIPKKTITFRKYKTINHNILCNELSTSDLVMSPSADLNCLVSEYNSLLSSLMDTHAPSRTSTLVMRPLVPWMTKEILEEKRLCRQFERKWRKTKLTVHIQIFKAQRKVVRLLIRKSKVGYFTEKVRASKGNQKALFRLTNELLHPRDIGVLPHHQSTKELANRFSEYFLQKIIDIRRDLDEKCNSQSYVPGRLNAAESSVASKLQFFTSVTEDEVSAIIKSSSSASCDLDPWPTGIIKKHLGTLVPVLTKIVNLSLTTGHVPDCLKEAIVKPLLKKPGLNNELLKNYRPISNISFLSKIIEKVVGARLNKYLNDNDLHEPLQSAYKSFHSTESALLKVQNDILSYIDNRKGVILVLLDLSAAFDTVEHGILLSLMESRLGITGTVLNWFQSYLNNRTQKVSVGKSLSSLSNLQYGVPQGSVLGPILFTIYILPMGDIARRHGITFHIYADDTQIYCSFDLSDSDDTKSRIENCIADIRLWMISHKLKLNDDKTEIIILTAPNQNTQVNCGNIVIGDSFVAPAASARNLGVIFDHSLTMESHIKMVSKNAYYHLRNIASIRNTLCVDSAKALVHAFISSRLDYCNSLLYGLPQKSIDRLQRVQNMAARLITGTKITDHITPVLYGLHWLPISQRIAFKIITLTFKALHGLAPQYLTQLIRPYRPRRSLRSANKDLLDLPKMSLKRYGCRSFQYAAPTLWNNLPESIRSNKEFLSFKSSLKTYLFKNYFTH